MSPFPHAGRCYPGRCGAPLRLPASFGEGATVVVHRCLSCPPAAAAAAVTAPPAQPLPLPLYVRADPASHVWLAVGQVGFGFAGDQAAVCGMLRAACAPLVTSAAATNGSDDDDDDDGAKESSANQ